MGGKCLCIEKKEENEVRTHHIMSYKEKINARKVIKFLKYTIMKRKAKELNDNISVKLKELLQTFAFKDQNSEEINGLEKSFEKFINQGNDLIYLYGLDKTKISLEKYKSLTRLKEEIKAHYINHHLNKYPNLIDAIVNEFNNNNPEEDANVNANVNNNNDVFNAINGDSADKNTQTTKKNGIQNIINIAKKKFTNKDINIKNDNMNNSGSQNNLNNSNNKNVQIISLSKKEKDKIIETEFSNLYHYYRPNEENRILNLFIERKNRFPAEFRFFINKYFYFWVMYKCRYIINTQDKFCKIYRKEIQKIVKEKYLGEEIVKENFGDIMSFVKKMEQKFEKEDENLLIDLRNQAMLYSMQKGFGNDKIGIQEGNNRYSVGSSVKQIPKIEKNEKNEKFQEKIKKINQKLKKTQKQHTMQNFPNGFNNNNNNQSKIDINNAIYEFYNGEFDKSTLFYCGEGKLIKPNYYIYEGTFRMSKKHGIGIIFKITKNETIYYRGEYSYNKPDGFGFAFVITINKIKYFRKGKFEKGKFVEGFQIKIEEVNKQVHIEEYEGQFNKELYHNQGKLNKKILKLNELDDKKFEIENEYLYLGNFVNNKENGKGSSKKVFPALNYYFTYEGDYYDGKMHGEGFIEFNGDTMVNSYRGIFERDQWFVKYGIVEFKSGDVYEGFFDYPNGKNFLGLYKHFDKRNNKFGEHFFGQFKKDKKNGFGKFIMKDNKLLVGEYKNGEKEGAFGIISNSAPDDGIQMDSLKLSFLSNITKNSNNAINAVHTNTKNKNSNNTSQILFKGNTIKQTKQYYLFENDEVIDKSDRPFK